MGPKAKKDLTYLYRDKAENTEEEEREAWGWVLAVTT